MRRATRQLIGILAAAVIAGVGLAFIVSSWPRQHTSPFVEGQPLLGQAADWFSDAQIGLQFKPPTGWSMQARTTATSKQHISPRMVVKFKRLLPNEPVAWIRINVLDAPSGDTPASYLRTRRPPEKDWKVIKEVEDGIKVAGQAGARITFSGPFDPDGRGKRNFTAEITALRHGTQFIELVGTFPSDDKEGRKAIQSAIETVMLSK